MVWIFDHLQKPAYSSGNIPNKSRQSELPSVNQSILLQPSKKAAHLNQYPTKVPI